MAEVEGSGLSWAASGPGYERVRMASQTLVNWWGRGRGGDRDGRTAGFILGLTRAYSDPVN